jgi:putative restriction endonuclease
VEGLDTVRLGEIVEDVEPPRTRARRLKTPPLRAYVGVTDGDWFELLQSQSALDEVNFWQPGGNRLFRVLAPGEPFLFKLHSPNNFVVGGGVFAHATLLPASLAWESFGVANGASTLAEMRRRIEKYRRAPTSRLDDYTIGCILIEQPFFLPRDLWIPVPDWKTNIVQGRSYDLSSEAGLGLWHAVNHAVQAPRAPFPQVAEGHARYGEPTLVKPRLGQGSFRVLVTDAYQRRCAFTQERTLPVLQAAHIQAYSDGGDHRVDNGLLLRSDLHALFDRGYVTVTPDYRIDVSRRIREEFENGRDYYALAGKTIALPVRPDLRPRTEFLQWHNDNTYLG